MRKAILAGALMIIGAATNASAEAPNLFTYQGRLKEGGQAVSANRTVEIKLCPVETGGSCETTGAQSVAVSNGLFRSTFTIPAAVNFGTGSWWLEIKVGADTLAPRERLTSNAYSLFSATAAYAENISAATGSDGVYISSNLYVTGGKYYGDGSQLQNLPVSGGAVAKTGDAMTGQLTLYGSTLTVGGNAFSVGGAAFRVENGRIGIGTVAPSGILEINGTDNPQLLLTDLSGDVTFAMRYSNGAPRHILGVPYYNDRVVLTNKNAPFPSHPDSSVILWDSGVTTLQMGTGGYLSFVAGTATEKARFTPQGNFGIGTTAPLYRLVVSSAAGEAGNMLVISTGTSDVIRLTGAGEIYANRYYGDGSALTGVTATGLADGSLLRVSTFTAAYQVMLSTAPGAQLTVGTDAPAVGSRLTVDGGIKIVSGGLSFPDSTFMNSAGMGSAGAVSSVVDADLLADSDSDGAGDIVLRKPALQFMRITNSGKVGIGSTFTADGGATPPAGNLDLDGSLYVGNEGIYDRDDAEVNVKENLIVEGGRVTGANSEYLSLGETNDVISLFSGGAEKARIHSNGYFGVGLAAPTANLHVSGDIRSNAGVRGGAVSIGAYAGDWTAVSNEVRANGSTHLLLQQTNPYNVGIGTDTPREKLHIRGSVRSDYGVMAATASFSGDVSVNGVFDANSGQGNTVQLSSTVIYGTLQVTGGFASAAGLPAYLSSTQTFTGQNIFQSQVTVSSDIVTLNRIGIGVSDFDFAGSKYLQVGDSNGAFINDNALAYLVGGANADAKLNFYRGATEAARLETQGGANLAMVLNGQTKTLTDATYHRIQNSIVWISTGYQGTPSIYVSSYMGNVGIGTAVLDPNWRLTVDGNLRISGGGNGLIFPDGSSMTTAGGVADDAVTSAKIAAGAIMDSDINAGAAIDAAKIGAGGVTSTEFGYLGTATSDLQTQLNGKLSTALADGKVFVGNVGNEAAAVTISGDLSISNSGVTAIAVGAIVDSDINAGAAIDATKIGAGGVTSAEFGYLGGATSDIQTQLNTKASDIAVPHLIGDESIGGRKTFTSTVTVNNTTLISANNPLLLSNNAPYGSGIRHDQAGNETMIIAARNSATKIFLATGYDVSPSPGVSITLPASPEITVNNGKVGIGTTSPGATLDVNGNARIPRYLVEADDAGKNLTSADFGKTITVNAGTTQTITLPAVGAGDIGAQITVVKLGAGTVAVVASGGAAIADSGPDGSIRNDTASETYAVIVLRLVSATQWIITGGNGLWTTATQPA